MNTLSNNLTNRENFKVPIKNQLALMQQTLLSQHRLLGTQYSSVKHKKMIQLLLPLLAKPKQSD